MSREGAIRFLKKLRSIDETLERLQGGSQAEDCAVAENHANLAAELGEDASADDIATVQEEVEAGIRQRTQAALAEVMELDDSDLEHVAGGTGNPECIFEYKGTCWSDDYCAFTDTRYPCPTDWAQCSEDFTPYDPVCDYAW